MTQGIEHMLNLPAMEDVMREKGVLPSEDDDAFPMPDLSAHGIDDSAQITLPMLTGIDHAEAMDKVYAETLKHAQDIMDLGFNIDHARSVRMFEAAATMYSKALDAKNSKRDAQLKAMKLALDQRRVEIEERRLEGKTEDTSASEGDAVVCTEDRNALLRQIRKSANDD